MSGPILKTLIKSEGVAMLKASSNFDDISDNISYFVLLNACIGFVYMNRIERSV